MTLSEALWISQKLFAIYLFASTIEYFKIFFLGKTIQGLRFNSGISKIATLILLPICVNLSLSSQAEPYVFFLCIVTLILLNINFFGSFNGGSDSMALVVCMGLLISSLTKDSKWQSAGLVYIGVQSILSYFIAGLVKHRNSEWRQGTALSNLFLKSSYVHLPSISKVPQKWLKAFCLGLIAFELSSALIFFSTPFTMVFIFLGACFHLANFYFLGLNRFFWAWLCTYPALIYLSGRDF